MLAMAAATDSATHAGYATARDRNRALRLTLCHAHACISPWVHVPSGAALHASPEEPVPLAAGAARQACRRVMRSCAYSHARPPPARAQHVGSGNQLDSAGLRGPERGGVVPPPEG